MLLCAVATVTVVALGLVAAVGSAKNPNTLSVVLQDLPGPGEVTFGQNVASTLTVSNPSANPWNKVLVSAPAPETELGTETLKSTLVYTNGCPGPLTSGTVGTSDTVICDLGTLDPRGTEAYTLLFVWQVPSGGSSTDCASAPCITNTVTVTGSEGTSGPDGPPSQHEDTFSPVVETTLLDSPDTDKRNAGTYVFSSCGNPAVEKSLETNQIVGTGNPLATKVCAPTVPGVLDSPGDPGLVATITERPNTASERSQGIRTQISQICIPDVGERCETAGYDPWDFSPFATNTFTIDDTAVKGGPITKVFYDDDEDGNYDLLNFTFSTAHAYVVSITIDQAAKKTIVVVKSPGNGRNGYG